jgi:hypothetical protein
MTARRVCVPGCRGLPTKTIPHAEGGPSDAAGGRAGRQTRQADGVCSPTYFGVRGYGPSTLIRAPRICTGLPPRLNS